MKKRVLFLLLLSFLPIILVYSFFPNILIANPTDNHSDEIDTYLSAKIFLEKITHTTKNTQGIPVLMYHHLLHKHENTKFTNNSAVMSVETFESQMKLLYDNGYYTITLKQLKEYIDGKVTLPQKSIMITFDDGYKSSFVYAYPILKEYGFNAVQFLITSLIRDDATVHFSPDRLSCLSKNEAIQSKDVFEFQSHTNDLHHKQDGNSVLLTETRTEIISDLNQSHSLVQNINSTSIKAFAYPYGAYNEDTINILQELNYDMAFTTKQGRVQPGDPVYELNRFVISDKTTMQKFKYIIGLQ